MDGENPFSKLIEELHPKPTVEDPYPKAASSTEPLKFYVAQTGLEILIVRAKEDSGRISRKLYNEVLTELKRIADDPKIPKNFQLVCNELISHYQKAATLDTNTVSVDIPKMEAILDVLKRA